MSAADRLPRVLVSGVVLGQPMGGVRRHNAELLPRAARLLAAGGGALGVLEGALPIPFALPPEVERLATRVPWRPPALRALLEGRALHRALRAARAAGRPWELVHLGHLPAPRGLPVPYTLTIHDLRHLELPGTPRARRMVASRVLDGAVARAACTVTVSQTVRERIEERFRPRRVVVVPNAADHLAVHPRRGDADAPLLHVGHLEPRKNLGLLLRVLALDPALPDLVLAGAPKHGEDQRLARRAEELGVADRVRFLGPVPDDELPELYARAACVVLPSELEGFGIAVVEAQRARAPLAVSDAGALPEVAGDGVPRFPPHDPAAAVAAVRAALQTGAAELEERARRAERFSWDASARLLVEAWSAATGR